MKTYEEAKSEYKQLRKEIDDNTEYYEVSINDLRDNENITPYQFRQREQEISARYRRVDKSIRERMKALEKEIGTATLERIREEYRNER